MNWAVGLWVLLYWCKELKDRDYKTWNAADGTKKGNHIKTRNKIPEQSKVLTPACTRHQKHRLLDNAQEWGGTFYAKSLEPETNSGTMKVVATEKNDKFHNLQNGITLSMISLLHLKRGEKAGKITRLQNPQLASTDLPHFSFPYGGFTSKIHLSFIWVIFLSPT